MNWGLGLGQAKGKGKAPPRRETRRRVCDKGRSGFRACEVGKGHGLSLSVARARMTGIYTARWDSKQIKEYFQGPGGRDHHRRCGGTKSAIAAFPIAKFALKRPIIALLAMASQRSVKKPSVVENMTVTSPPERRKGLRPAREKGRVSVLARLSEFRG